MEKDSVIEEAPIYFGGKDEKLWFIDGDDEYKDHKRYEFDDNIMEALVAIGIGENRCPTDAQWAEFCIVNAVVAALTGQTTIIVPKNISLSDLEKYSWGKLWDILQNFPQDRKTKEMYKKFSIEFIGSIMRIFITSHHTIDGPGRPYNQSYFVTRWTNWDHYPDWFNDKVGNVRLKHLQRGREVFKCFSKEIQKNIGLIATFIPPILHEINLAIKK